MVNVHIHQFQAGDDLVDEAAMEQFQKQWTSYQKLVDADWLSHRAAGDHLAAAIAGKYQDGSFSIVDIACGDASLMRRVLPPTPVVHYHGIDLAEPALELAAKNLADVAFDVDLHHRDFVAAMNDRPEPAHLSWCSLSIHHLPTDHKRNLLAAIRGATSDFMMMYEPSLREGEDRAGFLDRFVATNRPLWTNLTGEEWGDIEHHVRTCDLPETSATWQALARDAGFAKAQEVFVDPTDLYRLYRFDV